MPPSADERNVTAVKNALRARMSVARRALAPAEVAAARAEVRGHVLARAGADATAGRPWRLVFAYVPLPTEPGSTELLAALTDAGASVHVPVLRPDRDLDWIRWPDSDPAGVGAVRSATTVLVPALAVDRSGMRLGRGGGSYDRALSRVGPLVPVAALLHRGEFLDDVPAQPWDRPVTAAVDPDGWHDLPESAG